MSAPTRPTTVPDVLDAAADHIQQHGWNQGDYASFANDVVTVPACCAVGAIHYVVNGHADDYDNKPIANNAKEALIVALGHTPSDLDTAIEIIGDWNDAKEQTADEVVATLRRVAQQQRQTWRPANHGVGERCWFLVRHESVPVDERFHTGVDGQLVRYGSWEAAKTAADQLNAQQRATQNGGA